MSMEHPISKFEPKSSLESKFNPLLKRVPESAWFKLASMWCDFEHLVISAKFNFSDTDEPA
jgi:hypothetical protein